jgi:lipopolysaccharide export system protein LptA
MKKELAFYSALGLAAVLMAFLSGLAYAQAAGSGQKRTIEAGGTGTEKGPISISADSMTSDDAQRVVTFTGRVIARQDDLVITCDLMRVWYQPRGGPGAAQGAQAAEPEGEPYPMAPPADSRDEALEGPPQGQAAAPSPRQDRSSPLSGSQEIDRVDCEGDVKIRQGDRLAVGNKALYMAKAIPRRLVLTGEARVWQGQNSVTGHQVIYYLDENRSLVESRDNHRVRAYLDQSK